MKETKFQAKTSEEVLQMLEKIGHEAIVYVNVKKQYDVEEKAILNNAVVYDAYGGQIGMADNKTNAESALKQIKKTGNKFRVFSSVFSWATGEYEIVD